METCGKGETERPYWLSSGCEIVTSFLSYPFDLYTAGRREGRGGASASHGAVSGLHDVRGIIRYVNVMSDPERDVSDRNVFVVPY